MSSHRVMFKSDSEDSLMSEDGEMLLSLTDIQLEQYRSQLKKKFIQYQKKKAVVMELINLCDVQR